jgi:hypothetical protein
MFRVRRLAGNVDRSVGIILLNYQRGDSAHRAMGNDSQSGQHSRPGRQSGDFLIRFPQPKCPEFNSRILDRWAHHNRVTLEFSHRALLAMDFARPFEAAAK